ncbi:MAG: hypothetical protein KIT60_11920 [Burkholderiaceae bacterium]|nr:hypothetical protein [Burkholderiaceae bacterium]
MWPQRLSADGAPPVRLRRAALACALVWPCALGAAKDYSPAEQAIFMDNHLANVRPPAALHYRYVKGGSMEPGFQDRVTLKLTARDDRKCCNASAEFLSGERRLALPEVQAAEGNPVLLYFLERDIREMSRLTKGQQNYFRKRIRMAIYRSAEKRELTLPYRGSPVAAQQFSITPYVDDPLRERFAKLVGKRYTFTLSDAVPGGVYAVRSQVDAEGGAPPLWIEEMTLQ